MWTIDQLESFAQDPMTGEKRMRFKFPEFHAASTSMHDLDLTDVPEVSMEQLKEGAENYEEASAAGNMEVRVNPYSWECGYCKETYKSI